MMKRIFAYLALLAALMLTATGCADKKEPAQADFFAMDTFITLKAYGANAESALSECRREVSRLETLLSVTSAQGDVYRINHAAGKPVRVAPETAEVLSDALTVCAETGGAFDPTVYPLVECWGFINQKHRVPEAREIASLLPLVGYENVDLHGDTVTLRDGAGIDLGGVAKGYVTDRLVALLRERGVKSALLSLGGNVYALGEKPDGGAWRVAIQDPADADAVVGVVSVQDKAVITSGSYQRRFISDGVAYHHILNPLTGYPADNALSSVTIVCENGVRADALSTALFVMGYDRAVSFWRKDGGFAAVFVFNDGTVAFTENISFITPMDNTRKIAK